MVVRAGTGSREDTTMSGIGNRAGRETGSNQVEALAIRQTGLT